MTGSFCYDIILVINVMLIVLNTTSIDGFFVTLQKIFNHTMEK